jgi:hypothetical protein
VALSDHVRALLGVSAYQPAPRLATSLDSPQVETIREAIGGQLQPIPVTPTRWYLSDLEAAEIQADQGQIRSAAQLMRAAFRDGVLAGVMSTRTSGLVRLPKRFNGNPEIILSLEQGSTIEARSVFDEMCPASELAMLVRDGETLGVGVAELVPVDGRDYPVLVRLDPEFLVYVWSENRWYFRSVAGMIPIVPGDGRWVLHTPGGRIAPWQSGLWRALGRAYIRKEHANLHKDNWEGKLANPARVAVAPQGATEEQAQSWFRSVLAWGVNTVFGMKPGYDVKLVESNGRGHESFEKTIADQNNEFVIAVCGQTVTTDGGTGFANADVHRSIRADLIKATADALAYTVNTQILPQYVVAHFGEDALANGATIEWDVAPPKDKTAEATSLTSAAGAIKALTEALAPSGRTVDVDALCTRFGVPLVRAEQAAAAPVADVVPIRKAVAA